jgi:hypothetical protein
MRHYPDRKTIQAEKLEQWIKPFAGIKKECIKSLLECQNENEKIGVLKLMLKKMEKHIQGKYGNRIRWYSLCEDNGQWKKMDRFVHGMIMACIRKAKIKNAESFAFPSVHANILSIKKLRESQ